MVTISKEEGSVFPEGGCLDVHEYDICVPCFDSKIVPLLDSLDAEPTFREIDF